MSTPSTPLSADELKTESLLKFPCDFPIKIMGKQSVDFVRTMLDIVHRHAADFDASSIESRPSTKGNYLSITCTINATSQAQLDALYRELSGHPLVAMAL